MSSISQTTGPFHDLQTPLTATFGGPFDYSIEGPAGHLVALNFAFEGTPFFLPLADGSLLTGPPIISFGDVQLDLAAAPGTTSHLPMHLHGHRFRLATAAGGATHAPVKDTVLIYPDGHPASSASISAGVLGLYGALS